MLAETDRSLLSETRALRLARELGWRAEATANLRRLVAMSDTPRRDLAALRSEAAACFAELDAQPAGGSARPPSRPGTWPSAPGAAAPPIADAEAAGPPSSDLELGRPATRFPLRGALGPAGLRCRGAYLATAGAGHRVEFRALAEGARTPRPIAGPGIPREPPPSTPRAVAWRSPGTGTRTAP